MKKVIAATLLIGSTATGFAQDRMHDAAVEMQAGQEFAQKLVRNAVTTGKTGDAFLTYNGAKGWDCNVRIGIGATSTIVTEHAGTPERACVKAVLALDKTNSL